MLRELIRRALQFIRDVISIIIRGILNFVQQVVGWFKSLRLNPKKDIPFIANKEQFKESLKSAPRKSVGIFEGVFNEDADEITHIRALEADELDAKTKSVLGNEEIVVLT
ncbi:MAG: hypothetical protein MJZ24_09110 [Paludibacteraceae bacterium]|nr:hypothetical protein [Paludibacteraceae bacterium]